MSINKLPEEVKPAARKNVVKFLLLFSFLFITISMLKYVWGNPWAVTAMMLILIATIVLIFKTSYTLKELLN